MADQQIIIIDNFFKDPDAVRAAAIQSGFKMLPGGTYPGKMTGAFLSPEIDNAFSSIVGAQTWPRPESWYGQFRLSLASDPFEQWIHFDFCPWSAIAYMNPTYPAGYGTAFWQHKATGWTEYPETREIMLQGGYVDYSDVRERLVLKDGLDETKWNQMQFVEGVYNRIIIFRPTMFHSHMPKGNFGVNEQDGRLVQLFFFNEMRL